MAKRKDPNKALSAEQQFVIWYQRMDGRTPTDEDLGHLQIRLRIIDQRVGQEWTPGPKFKTKLPQEPLNAKEG